MQIRVHYCDSSNKNSDEMIELPKLSSVQSLTEKISLPYPVTAVINGAMVPPGFVLQEDSEVFVFRQMAGG